MLTVERIGGKFNFVDCFWQDKLCPNMRIIFNLKDRKDWRNAGAWPVTI